MQGGVQLRNTAKTEQSATPTGCLFLPPKVQGADAAVITANDQYKLRVIAPGLSLCSALSSAVRPDHEMVLLNQEDT